MAPRQALNNTPGPDLTLAASLLKSKADNILLFPCAAYTYFYVDLEDQRRLIAF